MTTRRDFMTTRREREGYMKHRDGGSRCLAEHWEKNGDLAQPCIRCEQCKKFIRPEKMDDECPGPPKSKTEHTYRGYPPLYD